MILGITCVLMKFSLIELNVEYCDMTSTNQICVFLDNTTRLIFHSFDFYEF